LWLRLLTFAFTFAIRYRLLFVCYSGYTTVAPSLVVWTLRVYVVPRSFTLRLFLRYVRYFARYVVYPAVLGYGCFDSVPVAVTLFHLLVVVTLVAPDVATFIHTFVAFVTRTLIYVTTLPRCCVVAGYVGCIRLRLRLVTFTLRLLRRPVCVPLFVVAFTVDYHTFRCPFTFAPAVVAFYVAYVALFVCHTLLPTRFTLRLVYVYYAFTVYGYARSRFVDLVTRFGLRSFYVWTFAL